MSHVDEWWDLLDADRRPTGRTVRRGAVVAGGGIDLQPDDFHLVVVVVVFGPDGRVLIQQRVADKEFFPGYWDVTAGGSVLAGETSQQGAARELAEEVGIEIDLTGVRPALTLSVYGGFDDFYVVDAPEGLDITALRLQEAEVAAVRWADKAEITALIDQGRFLPYQSGFIDLVFSLHDRPDSLRWRPTRPSPGATSGQ